MVSTSFEFSRRRSSDRRRSRRSSEARWRNSPKPCAHRFPVDVRAVLARARSAWRYFDGTFMPESVKLEAHFARYERYSAGGRARVATAKRYGDGTFAPNR